MKWACSRSISSGGKASKLGEVAARSRMTDEQSLIREALERGFLSRAQLLNMATQHLPQSCMQQVGS